MRVQLDNDRKSVDLEINVPYGESFLEVVMKALESLNYTKDDLLRFLNDEED